MLEREQWLNGGAVGSAFEPVLDTAWRSTVQVICGGRRVALGTIVRADGWIVTKASEVHDARSLGVVLHDGRSFRAKLAAMDDANDLGLLRIAAHDLPVISWSHGSAELGRWVATAWPAVEPGQSEESWWSAFGSELLRLGAGEEPGVATRPVSGAAGQPADRMLGVGVISASRRAVAREGGVIGVRLGPGGPRYGGVIISGVEPDSGAAAAGLVPGDIVTHVEGEATLTGEELSKAIRSHPPGKVLTIEYLRDGQAAQVRVTLGRQEQVFRNLFFDPHQALNGQVSARRDGFSAIIQHHIPIEPAQCGGPLIDLDGRAVGLNIARVNRSETYALPADVVRGAVDGLISQAQAAQ